MSTSRMAAGLVLAALIVAACERPDDTESAPIDDPSATVGAASTTSMPDGAATTVASENQASTTSAAASPAPTSNPAVSTTTPATAPASTASTTVPPPTTRPEPTSPADLVLAFDGVEPYLFGTPDADVIAALTGLLGDPVSDGSRAYPTPDDGMFVTDDGSLAFVFPFGRTVCFANGLCTEFGAGADSALLFTGWDFAGDDAAGLSTDDGITVGSRWADHLESIEVNEGGCFQEGYGNATGVEVVLLSSGEPFLATDDDGNQTPQVPDAADVTVTAMRAGELPYSPEADC